MRRLNSCALVLWTWYHGRPHPETSTMSWTKQCSKRSMEANVCVCSETNERVETHSIHDDLSIPGVNSSVQVLKFAFKVYSTQDQAELFLLRLLFSSFLFSSIAN